MTLITLASLTGALDESWRGGDQCLGVGERRWGRTMFDGESVVNARASCVDG